MMTNRRDIACHGSPTPAWLKDPDISLLLLVLLFLCAVIVVMVIIVIVIVVTSIIVIMTFIVTIRMTTIVISVVEFGERETDSDESCQDHGLPEVRSSLTPGTLCTRSCCTE